MASNNSVFICYRLGANEIILHIAVESNLKRKGADIFCDIEGVPEDWFESTMLHEIETRSFFMPFLSAGTLDGCLDPDDWYRRAVEAAVMHERAIVPIYDEKFDFSDIDKFLPFTLAQKLKESIMFELSSLQLQVILNQYLIPFQASEQESPLAFVMAKQAAIKQMQIDNGVKVAADPLNADSYVAKGLWETRAENWQAAIASYSEALRLDPKAAHVYAKRGIVRFLAGDLDGAIADLEVALELDPGDGITRDNLTHMYQVKYQS